MKIVDKAKPVAGKIAGGFLVAVLNQIALQVATALVDEGRKHLAEKRAKKQDASKDTKSDNAKSSEA